MRAAPRSDPYASATPGGSIDAAHGRARPGGRARRPPQRRQGREPRLPITGNRGLAGGSFPLVGLVRRGRTVPSTMLRAGVRPYAGQDGQPNTSAVRWRPSAAFCDARLTESPESQMPWRQRIARPDRASWPIARAGPPAAAGFLLEAASRETAPCRGPKLPPRIVRRTW